jgi:nitrilase
MQAKRMVNVAVIQASPVLFNKDQCIDKVHSLMNNTSSGKPDLVLLPEAFIPGYPRDLTFGTLVGKRTEEGKETWNTYYKNSVEVPSHDTEMLGEAARKGDCFLAIGVVEKDRGSLYCTLLYFGPDGALLGKHRKLKPTAAERIIWAEGDGSTLISFDTPVGRMGGLICWENYMPLARMALYLDGIQIYLAPTADQRDSWQTTLHHIALEGRCFVLGCNQFVTRGMYPADIACREKFPENNDMMCRGGSVIISPRGETLAGPLWDREGTLLAELDLDETIKGKMDLDVAGHYHRPDVFEYKVATKPGIIRIPSSLKQKKK